jgi:pantothenate kinase
VWSTNKKNHDRHHVPSLSKTRRRRTPPSPHGAEFWSLFDAPPTDIVVFDDVEDSLEEIEDLAPKTVEDAFELLEQQAEDVAEFFEEGGVEEGAEMTHVDMDDDGIQVVIQSSVVDIGTSKEELAGDIIEAMQEDEADMTMLAEREAAVSASLYMNPATGKIASNLVVTWEPAVAEILDRMQRLSNPSRPFLVGLVGIPGSGKSTSAEIVTTLLGGLGDGYGENHAIVMPMDGYHIPLQDLAESDNAADLIYRRGAPDTFDPAALFEKLNEIAYGDAETVTLPGFDHAKGDPVPNQHTFTRSENKVVIVEGIYLLHDSDGWEVMKRLFDWTIYIDADVDTCIERLKIRNKCIPVSIAVETCVGVQLYEWINIRLLCD